MYGAIIGDMVGSKYEFGEVLPPLNCKLFNKSAPYEETFTDDTVMTVAVASALIKSDGKNDNDIRKTLINEMHHFGLEYIDAGYGRRFYQWLINGETEPYGSFGNGSAMRVSSVGWLYPTLEETRRIARLTASVTHNHPEAMKGAEAVASAIWMARNGYLKEKISLFMEREFGYQFTRPLMGIRMGDRSPCAENVACRRTVQEAYAAFISGKSFAKVIQNAVSLGGDTDTIAAIAGSIAEAYYKIPKRLICECEDRLPNDMLFVLRQFQCMKHGGVKILCPAEEDLSKA